LIGGGMVAVRRWPAVARAGARRCLREPLTAVRSLPACSQLDSGRGFFTPRRFSTGTTGLHASLGRGPKADYEAALTRGELNPDPRQKYLVEEFQKLYETLQGYTPRHASVTTRPVQTQAAAAPKSGSFFSGFFGGGPAGKKEHANEPAPASERICDYSGIPHGMYVWGGTGCGKTHMMDVLHQAMPTDRKKRIHFHEWMIDVHKRLHSLSKERAQFEKANAVWTAEGAKAQRESLKAAAGKERRDGDDLIETVAQQMVDEAWFLCFDEFQVTHISDAIIMKRLFSVMFERGAVVVATSNRPPEDLYMNGLNRNLFIPFIPLLRERCEVLGMDSQVDYRLVTTQADEDASVYLVPLDEHKTAVMERKFRRIAGEYRKNVVVETQGRKITVPRVAKAGTAAWFTFADLCDKPLGVPDYLALATVFHTVFISDIPMMNIHDRNPVRRFINVIDCFYEKNVKVVCQAAAMPEELFDIPDEEKRTSSYDEVFAWDRTASRLQEMQSAEYLTFHTRDLDSERFLAQFNFSLRDETKIDDETINELWMRYDVDDSGALDHDEARHAITEISHYIDPERPLSEELMDIFFEQMDLDGNGVIERDEFISFTKKYGCSFSYEQACSLQRTV